MIFVFFIFTIKKIGSAKMQDQIKICILEHGTMQVCLDVIMHVCIK